MTLINLLTTFLGALLIGLSLGLLGAGGSILTVPILVYGLAMDEKSAIASAMLIVAAISLYSAIKKHNQEPVDLKTVAAFALTSIPATFCGAFIASLISGNSQLIVLSLLMLFAGYKMTTKSDSNHPQQALSKLKLAVIGVILGLITGIAGIGGGIFNCSGTGFIRWIIHAGSGINQPIYYHNQCSIWFYQLSGSF